MALDPLTALLDIGKTAIDKIFPDAESKQKRIAELEKLAHDGDMARLDAEVKLLLAQLEINKTEAQHKSVFVAGWRPFIGWCGGLSLAYQFIVYPLLLWVWTMLTAAGYISSDITPPPVLDSGPLFAMITGMLGIGAMRSYDKKNGVQTDKIK